MSKWAAKKIFRKTVAHSPRFVHRVMTGFALHRLSRHLMTVEDIKTCESSEALKEKILDQYKHRFPKEAEAIQHKIERHFEHNHFLRSKENLAEMKKDMEYCYFSYGFHPDEYVFFDLGGTNREAEKRHSFVSEQERWCFRLSANDFSDALLSDKADTYAHFSKYYKRQGLLVDRRTTYDQFRKFLNGKTEFVQKYVSSSRGQAVKLVRVAEIEPERYLKSLKRKGHFLLEDIIIQSEALNSYSRSINNIRVSTFKTYRGINAVCGFFTMGKKDSFVVNATIGCVFASIDCKTGVIESDGCDELGHRFEIHPDSGLPIKGFQLPDWDEAITLCIEIAGQLEHYSYVSFDLAHTVNGWDIIEINPSGQFLHQAGTLRGFRKELSELIDSMEQVSPYKLREYDS